MLAQPRAAYWTEWWEAHEGYALTLVGTLLFGGLMGALALEAVDAPTRLALLLLVKRFLTDEAGHLPQGPPLVNAALLDNMKVLGLLYIFGVSVVGIPLVLLAVFFRGFVVGFAVGFFLETMHGQGLALAAVSVALPNLLLVPAWLAVGAGGLRFSWRLLASTETARARLGPEFYQMTAVALAALVLVAAGSALEGLVAPLLLHWLARWGL
jgi:stage II sporulation protein M